MFLVLRFEVIIPPGSQNNEKNLYDNGQTRKFQN